MHRCAGLQLQLRLLSIGLQWYFGVEESQPPGVHDRQPQNRRNRPQC